MKLIDKDALVAEIERRIKKRDIQMKSGCWVSSTYMYEDLLDFISTLEVKDVDLEKEFDSFLDNIEGVPRMWHSDEQIEWAKDIARHFFELGIKSQKGE